MQSPTRAHQPALVSRSCRITQAAPLFDPAAFYLERPRPASPDEHRAEAAAVAAAAVRTPYSSASSSVRHSAASSTSSLGSTGSSTSTQDGAEDRDEEEDDCERKRCLDLLDQLQLEVTRLNQQHAATAPGLVKQGSTSSRQSVANIETPEKPSTPSTPTHWRSMNYAPAEPASRPLRSRTPSPARRIQRSPRIQRRNSRCPSGGAASDMANLDLDSILAAYERDGVLPSLDSDSEPELDPDNQVQERWRTWPAPSEGEELDYRPGSPTPSTSSASALSVLDERFPHRRVAPFPTVPRPKSSASLRSAAHLQRGPHPAPPPVPVLPSVPHALLPHSHRIFTTFPTAAAASTSTSTAPFPPSVRPPTSTAMRPVSSRDSRYSTASSSTRSTATSRSSSSNGTSRRDSHRWSIATVSTEASSLGCVSDEHHCASGRSVRFDSVDEADELIVSAEFARLPVDAQPPVLTKSAPTATARTENRRDSCGLISWQDFAHELDEVTPPPRARPTPGPLPRGAAFPAHPSAVLPFESRPAAPTKHYSRAAHPPTRTGSASRSEPVAHERRTTTRLGRGLVRRGFGTIV
ncbi:hypothetical protein JCM3774_000861 [Rhodotorula dairenensis]